MVKRVSEKLADWDEGRAFMNRMADELGASVQEIDADLAIEHEAMKITCHMHPREYASILVKLYDESYEDQIKSILDNFEKK